MQKTKEQIAVRVSLYTMTGNVLLSAFKLFAGISAQSAAMLSDAVHSLSDVFGTLIVIVGIKLSSRKSDQQHPYGHERMECVAAILLAFLLFLAGALIGWGGIQRIRAVGEGPLPVPGVLALAAALTSIVAKEAMYWYTRAAAKKIDSVALMAEAWHHRSDALSSVGSFAGILGARVGVPVLDPVACIVICLFILKAALGIFREAVGKMLDTSCDDAVLRELGATVLAQDAVLGVDQLKTRLFGDKIYVDAEISVDGSITLAEAHEIAQRVHDAIEADFPKVKHCMVHVNPAGPRAEEMDQNPPDSSRHE